MCSTESQTLSAAPSPAVGMHIGSKPARSDRVSAGARLSELFLLCRGPELNWRHMVLQTIGHRNERPALPKPSALTRATCTVQRSSVVVTVAAFMVAERIAKTRGGQARGSGNSSAPSGRARVAEPRGLDQEESPPGGGHRPQAWDCWITTPRALISRSVRSPAEAWSRLPPRPHAPRGPL
jgi:hypothetical protein